MSVTVRIRQNSLFRKKPNIDDIIELTGLSCGVCDAVRGQNGKI